MSELFPTQEQYLENLGHRPYMFAGTGAGKTRMSIIRAKRAGYNKILVITPATVRDTKQWEQEVEKIGVELEELQVEGYHFLQTYRDRNLAQYHDWYVIIDEAHKIKNSTSLQGLGAYHLLRIAGDYSLLSATPMSEWKDAANYAKITGLVKNKTEFYRKFVIEEPSYVHKGKDIVGYKRIRKLEKWWHSIALRAKSEDFTDLPTKNVMNIGIKMEVAGYRKLVNTRMKDGEPLDSPSKLNWALRTYTETSPKKLKWVVEKIEGLENAIVFVNTKEAIRKLSEALTKAGISHGQWHGDRKDRFEDQKVMIVQYQSGGTGLNLQKFNNTIFLSPSYSYTDYHQAMGRTWRTGQTKRCNFYQLRSTGSIDYSIYKALEAKKDFDDSLVENYAGS